MATLTVLPNHSIDMGGSIFVDDPSQLVAMGDLRFGAAMDAFDWNFDGANVTSTLDPQGDRVVTGGTVHAMRYFIQGVETFESLDLPSDTSAVTVFNTFRLPDNNALFGTLLIGNDRINGANLNDVMAGFGGNDVLNGMNGADRLTGGVGNDTLRGMGDDDRLTGGAGLDRLEGGLGKDQLTGNQGADAFVFDTVPKNDAADLITDFQPGVDAILLDHTVFTALSAGPLGGEHFVSRTDIGPANSTAGITPDDRILYDRDSGRLYYDSNGSLAGHRVLVAILHDGHGAAVVGVSAGDFTVF